MYDRQLLWDQSRKNKIKQLKETLCLNEIEDCTFQPQLISSFKTCKPPTLAERKDSLQGDTLEEKTTDNDDNVKIEIEDGKGF
jgi:hypothetical protein